MNATTEVVNNWVQHFVKPIYLGGHYEFTVNTGRKFHRIWTRDEPDEFNTGGGQKSCWGFIDFDGNIYKAATYKAPAKHIRGNIFVNEGQDALDPHGFVKYLI